MFDLKHLPNEAENEKIVFFLRRHPITLMSLIVGYVFIFLFPFIAWWYVSYLQPELWQVEVTRTLIILGCSLFFLFSWLFLFQSFIDYYLDIWIVTNRRILNIEQTGLFSRKISELRLHRIQDVTSNVSGMISTIFDFGNVKIQTAGEEEHFIFEEIPHPTKVAKAILEYADADRRQELNESLEELSPGVRSRSKDPFQEPTTEAKTK